MRPRLVKEIESPQNGFDGNPVEQYYLLTPADDHEGQIVEWTAHKVSHRTLSRLGYAIDEEVGVLEEAEVDR